MKELYILMVNILLISSCVSNKKKEERNAGNKLITYKENVSNFQKSEYKTKNNMDELTEEELLEIEMKKRYEEENEAYSNLNIYSGVYEIYTESEGVDAKLILDYQGDKTFKYKWELNVAIEETKCKGKLEGIIFMDRTQHGFSQCDNTTVHFNFNGLWDGYLVVEMEFEDKNLCKNLSGDCNFNGIYRKKY